MAIRKEIFKALAPVDDVDTATVVDIICQGFEVSYVQDAVAYDIPPHSLKSEFKMRIRGTSKTLSSLGRRANLSVFIKNPILCWSVLSHRVFRYFTPYLMIALFFTNLYLISENRIYLTTFYFQTVFYLLAVIGWIANSRKRNLPLASSAFSFCTAMSGMMIGVAKALSGRVTVTYQTDDTVH